jgi:hypothetical protein
MIIKELSATIENRAGYVWKVFQALADSDVNILSYSIADKSEQVGSLRLIVDNITRAEAALTAVGVATHTNEVYSLAIPNVTGSMADVLKRLAEHEVSIHYMYAFQYEGISQAIIRANDMTLLARVLTDYELETKL